MWLRILESMLGTESMNANELAKKMTVRDYTCSSDVLESSD